MLRLFLCQQRFGFGLFSLGLGSLGLGLLHLQRGLRAQGLELAFQLRTVIRRGLRVRQAFCERVRRGVCLRDLGLQPVDTVLGLDQRRLGLLEFLVRVGLERVILFLDHAHLLFRFHLDRIERGFGEPALFRRRGHAVAQRLQLLLQRGLPVCSGAQFVAHPQQGVGHLLLLGEIGRGRLRLQLGIRRLQ